MSERILIDALLRGKPYFGPALRALQGPAIRHQYFEALVEVAGRSKIRRRIRILEVGSWAGASAVSWATAIKKLGRTGRVTCVDPWQPYFDLEINHESHYREMNDAAKNNNVFQLFLHNIRAADVSDMVDYLVGNAREILPKLPSAKFDIIYLDGSHAYEDVRSDIRDAKRLVREGGIICGDDLELQKNDVDEQEHAAAVELQKDYVYSRKADGSYHPGVTEAVAVEFGEVSSWDGIWATRKVGSQWVRVELGAAVVQIPEHIKEVVPELEAADAGQTRDYLLLKIGKKYIATAKSLATTSLLRERIGDRELPPILFSGDSLEEVRTKAVEAEEERCPLVELVDATDGFNLVKSKGRFLAVAKQLGPMDLFQERVGERELAPVLFSGESLEEVREKAQVFEKQTVEPEVELVDEVGRFNVIKAGDRFLAVAKELGPVNLFRERIGERELVPVLFSGESLEEVREKVQTFEKQTVQPDPVLVEEVGAIQRR
jgi:predicted O-methyltransferase YrrM